MSYPTTLVRSSKTINKIGSFNIPLGICPFQPTKTGNVNGPRFMNNNGVGGYFGLTGYYRTIPCWQAIPYSVNSYGAAYHAYQFRTFTVNATGCFDVIGTLTNPFVYTAELTQSGATYGQFACNDGRSAQTPMTPMQSWEAVFVSESYSYTCLGAQTGFPVFNTPVINSPALSFAAQTVPACSFDRISSSQYVITPTQSGWGYITAWGGNPYLFLDDTFTSNVVDSSITAFRYQNGGTLYNFGFNWSIFSQSLGGAIQPPIAPIVFKNGTPTYLLNFGYSVCFSFASGGPSVSVNPETGNYIAVGMNVNGGGILDATNRMRCGNVMNTPYPAVFPGNDPYIIYDMVFGNVNDQAAIAGATSNYIIIQVPGGGWILIDKTSHGPINGFVVLPDFSGYYSITLSGATYGGGSYNVEQFGVDLNGIFYYLDYSTGSFGSLYYSGIGHWTVILSNPQLLSIGVVCKSPSCFPWGV